MSNMAMRFGNVYFTIILILTISSFSIQVINAKKSKDCYEKLGVSEDATEQQIKKSFRKLAMKYHPDRQKDKSEKEKERNEKKFKELASCYEILSDSEKRQQYDASSSYDDFQQRSGFQSNSQFNDINSFFKTFFGGAAGNGGAGTGMGGMGGIPGFGNMGGGNMGGDSFFSFGNNNNQHRQQQQRRSQQQGQQYQQHGQQPRNAKPKTKTKTKKERIYIDMRDIISDFETSVLNNKYTIDIGAGIPDGTIIKHENYEFEIFTIDSKNIWQRGNGIHRSDVTAIIDITLEEALFGFNYELQSIDDETIEIEIKNINELIEKDFELKYDKLGLPRYNGETRGNAFVKINVLFPNIKSNDLNKLKNAIYSNNNNNNADSDNDKRIDKFDYNKMKRSQKKKNDKELKKIKEKLNAKNKSKRKNKGKRRKDEL